jgi:membrane protein DedA with SNARE-associated domain
MLESLLSSYGYPILLLGTFLEGETVLILGGISAHLGYLSLVGVIACGFTGTFLGDQLYFFLGRRHGKKWLARHPSWHSRAARVSHLLSRHQDLVILGFRFLYGLRTVTPFAIGMSKVSYWRFTTLNLLGAGTWATGIGLAGYYFGHAIEVLLGDIRRYELETFASIAAVAALVWLVKRYRQHQSK